MANPNIESTITPTDFIIQGLTTAGRQFRPSDWADRLCGIMGRFHPDAEPGFDRHLRYSPYVKPGLVDGVRSVMVDARIHELEPLAYLFLRDFARDNDLRVIEACRFEQEELEVA